MQGFQNVVPFCSILFVIDKKDTGIQFLKYAKKLSDDLFLGKIYKLRTDLPEDFKHQYKVGQYVCAKLQLKKPVLLEKKINELSKKDQEHLLTDKYAIIINNTRNKQ